jgi:hypothetical protein
MTLLCGLMKVISSIPLGSEYSIVKNRINLIFYYSLCVLHPQTVYLDCADWIYFVAGYSTYVLNTLEICSIYAYRLLSFPPVARACYDLIPPYSALTNLHASSIACE